MDEENKKEKKFHIVSQSEEEIERNRKIIEEMRAKGLLENHEKTFQVQKDGTVIEVEEDNKK